jgi:membrane fusion protein (multidrug efflux system)
MTLTRTRRRLSGGWLVVLACGWMALAGCNKKAGTERTPPPPTVSVVEARRMTVPMTAEPFGTTQALKQVSIRARVRGFLTEKHFEEGSDVKAGQLLFVIDEAPFKATLDAAKAQLAQAEANLDKARKSKAREVAQAQLDLAVAQAQLAQIEEKRAKILFGRNAGTLEDLDKATAQRKQADAQVESAKASLEQAKADYDVNIEAAQASVASARASVTSAEIDLSYCRMFAPIDGRIGEVKVKLGNLVGAASGGTDYTELATVQQLDPMGVNIQVSSRYLARATELIREGLMIRIYRPGLAGEEEHSSPGKATFIDNVIDPNTSTFLVKGEVPNPGKTLLPGEYVKVAVKYGEVKDAIVVPEQAVMEAQGGQVVYTVDAQGKVALARVKATLLHNGLRVIESGLEPGQRVIVEGIQLVRPGMVVRVEAPKDDAAKT